MTRFVWIAAAGTAASGAGEWKTSLVFAELGEDHPGRPRRRAAGVLQPRGQPDPDRVPAPAPGPGPLHVLLRPGGVERGPGGLGGDRRPSRDRRNRCGSSAPIRSTRGGGWRNACVEFPFDMARVLVLNATYEPINVCTLRRAAVLLLKEKAELLERRQRRPAFRAHDDGAPRRDPPGQLRAHPAGGAPAQDHPPRGAGARLLDLPILRLAQVGPDRRPCHPPQPRAANRSGRTSSPPAPAATGARATGFPARSRCTPAGGRGRRGRPSSSKWRARRSRRPGSSTYRRQRRNGHPPPGLATPAAASAGRVRRESPVRRGSSRRLRAARWARRRRWCRNR